MDLRSIVQHFLWVSSIYFYVFKALAVPLFHTLSMKLESLFWADFSGDSDHLCVGGEETDSWWGSLGRFPLSQSGCEASYATTPCKGRPKSKAPPNAAHKCSFFSLLLEDAPLRSFAASHTPNFFAHPKKKKEREKIATSRGVDRHFRRPGKTAKAESFEGCRSWTETQQLRTSSH